MSLQADVIISSSQSYNINVKPSNSREFNRFELKIIKLDERRQDE
jgi:hypothetical protein